MTCELPLKSVIVRTARGGAPIGAGWDISPLLECGGTSGGYIPHFCDVVDREGQEVEVRGTRGQLKFGIVGCDVSKVLNFSARCALYHNYTIIFSTRKSMHVGRPTKHTYAY